MGLRRDGRRRPAGGRLVGRGLDPDYWGTEDQQIDSGLLGSTVDRGEFLGWAGSTGPGGCGCEDGVGGPNDHLHIFFAHRDPTDDRWYFIDPYGIYGPTECYPTRNNITGSLEGACIRYPVAWLGGRPQLPTTTMQHFRRGDSNADGTTDISDAVAILGFLFLGTTMNDCKNAADVNDDGKVDISDPVRLLGFLFLGAKRPPDPFGDCGVNPTADDLDCNEFSKCASP